MDTDKRHPASPVCTPMPETLIHATADTPPPKSRHGMARRNIVVSVEDADYFRRFRNALYELYHPADDNESFMLDQIICHRWFLLHSDSAEAAAMRTAVREAEREPLATSDDDPSDVSRTESERDDRATAAMCCDHQVQLITRYRVRHERAHERWSNLLVQHQLHRGNAARLAKVPYHSYIRNRTAYYDKPPQPIDPPDDPYNARDVPADFANQPRAVAADVSIDTHDFPAALINQTRKITIDFPNDVHDAQDIHADPSTDAKKIAEDSVVGPDIATEPPDHIADLPTDAPKIAEDSVVTPAIATEPHDDTAALNTIARNAATDDPAVARDTATDKMSDAVYDAPEATPFITDIARDDHAPKPDPAAQPAPVPQPESSPDPAPKTDQPSSSLSAHNASSRIDLQLQKANCGAASAPDLSLPWRSAQITAPHPHLSVGPPRQRANHSARLPVASRPPSQRANYGARNRRFGFPAAMRADYGATFAPNCRASWLAISHHFGTPNLQI